MLAQQADTKDGKRCLHTAQRALFYLPHDAQFNVYFQGIHQHPTAWPWPESTQTRGAGERLP